jgi:hypothetical protein
MAPREGIIFFDFYELVTLDSGMKMTTHETPTHGQAVRSPALIGKV